jgi:hypothetical protein
MSKTINILIGIDTDGIRRQWPNPSKDPKNPTGIDHKHGYMICTGTVPLGGQGTGDLSISANVGDTVRAFAISGSNNFEDSVLLYDMPRFQGDQVMSPFTYLHFTHRPTMVPTSPNVLPASMVDGESWFYQANIVTTGTESYGVRFALYTRDSNSGRPELLGYYWWDPTISVGG